jgi:ABC-2 type transport system ATP-binding protein
VIEVDHLSKSYGSLRAVSDVSFRVDKGEVVGFLGPNGAGKTTTLRMLAGFLGPTSGRITIAGHDLALEPMRVRERLGYMPEQCPLHPEMRVREYLTFRAELKGVARSARKAAVGRALELARVAEVADIPIGHLSKGFRQRVGLADALVASPPVLILDEPTAGLDPNQIRDVRDLVRGLSAEHAVLLSTHILPEVEATCSRALVIASGKLVAEGTIAELRSFQRGGGGVVVVRAERKKALAVARAVAGITKVRGEEVVAGEVVRLEVDFEPGVDEPVAIEALARALVEAGFGLREVAARKPSLEQVFSELTGKGDAEAAA